MERFERILVCIDQPDHDTNMLAYVKSIAEVAETKEIFLVHAGDENLLKIPVQMYAFANGFTPMVISAPGDKAEDKIDAMAKELKKLGETTLGQFGGTLHYDVLIGTPLMELLYFAHKKDVDLIVIGRNYGQSTDHGDTALLARRVTRKATCSVLTVPDGPIPKPEKILVPCRDSDCSAGALDVACGIASANNAEITALNVFNLYAGYSTIGLTLDEYQANLEKLAKIECENLRGKVNTEGVKINDMCIPDTQGRPVPVIMDAVASLGANMVIIGARGRSGAAGVLLGTVTEQLIRICPVPLFAAKKKGECLNVIKSVLSLAGFKV